MTNFFYRMKNKILSRQLQEETENPQAGTIYATQSDLERAALKRTEPDTEYKENNFTTEYCFAAEGESLADKTIETVMHAIRDISKKQTNEPFDFEIGKVRMLASNRISQIFRERKLETVVSVSPIFFTDYVQEKFGEFVSEELDIWEGMPTVNCRAILIPFIDNSIIIVLEIIEPEPLSTMMHTLQDIYPKLNRFLIQSNAAIKTVIEQKKSAGSLVEEHEEFELAKTDLLNRVNFATIYQSYYSNHFVISYEFATMRKYFSNIDFEKLSTLKNTGMTV